MMQSSRDDFKNKDYKHRSSKDKDLAEDNY